MAASAVQLLNIPQDAWTFIAGKASAQLADHVMMLDFYYKHVDKISNVMQRTVDAMLDDPTFWKSRGGRIQHICQRGSIRSGKSYLSYCKPVEWLHKFPKTDWLCMRRTNSQLTQSMMIPLRSFLNRFRIPYEFKLPSMTGPGEIRFPNGSRFVFWSSEAVVLDSSADNARGLGSMEFAGATLEEADTLHRQAVDTVPQRLSQRTGCPRVIFYNVNPTRKDHWIAKMFLDKKRVVNPQDFHEFKFTLLDNLPHLDPDFVESMKTQCQTNPALYRRFILGEWGPEAVGTPIYGPYFSRERHIAKTSFIDRWLEDKLYNDGDVCLCWDFGFKHPALVVFQDVRIGNGDDAFNHSFQQIRVLGAWLGDSISLGPFARFILSQLRIMLPNANWVSYGDPQGRNSDPRGVTQLNAFDIIRAETGLHTHSSKTDEQAGVDLIIDLLGRQCNHKVLGNQPEILIEPNEYFTGDFVSMLEVGFANSDKETGEDKLRPVNDQYFIHLADAWRYGVVHRRNPMRQGSQNIEAIMLGGSFQNPVREGWTNHAMPRQIGASHYVEDLLEFGSAIDSSLPFQTAYYGF